MSKSLRPFRAAIARRDLSVEGSRAKVRVEIGRPFSSDRCVECPIRITFGRRVLRREIPGEDAFQALDLAMKTISVELRYSSKLPIGRMYLYQKGDDMGFSEATKP